MDERLESTKAVYDATADQYARTVGTEVTAEFEAPLDRSILRGFVDRLRDRGCSRVADLGTGVGRIARFLHERDLSVVGIDLAPGMVAVARNAHPSIPFAAASLFDLPFAHDSLDGAVCWYSIIHTAPDELEQPFEEIARILRSEREVLFGFQAGDGTPIVRTEAHGTAHTLTNYRHDPDDIARRLAVSGFEVSQCAIRSTALSHETSPQAFIVARSAPSKSRSPR